MFLQEFCRLSPWILFETMVVRLESSVAEMHKVMLVTVFHRAGTGEHPNATTFATANFAILGNTCS
jgi:hypothetical protein